MPESASKNAKTEHLINITQSEPREGRELDNLNFDGENYSTFFWEICPRNYPRRRAINLLRNWMYKHLKKNVLVVAHNIFQLQRTGP